MFSFNVGSYITNAFCWNQASNKSMKRQIILFVINPNYGKLCKYMQRRTFIQLCSYQIGGDSNHYCAS